MKAILFKLDYPFNKYEWWVRDMEFRTKEDFINNFMGVCGEHIYAELYHTDERDDPILIEKVRQCFSDWYPISVQETLSYLMKFINDAIVL